MKLAFDFDGTLVALNPTQGDPTPGDWLPGAVDAIRSILDARHSIVIYSVRNNPNPFPGAQPADRERWWNAMVAKIRSEFASEVDAGRIEIDDGKHGKPFASHYFDDRAISMGNGPGQRDLSWVRSAFGQW